MSTFNDELVRYQMSTSGEEKAVRRFRLELDLADQAGFVIARCNAYRGLLVEGATIQTGEALDWAVAQYAAHLWEQIGLAAFIRAGGCDMCGKNRPADFKGCKRADCPFKGM